MDIKEIENMSESEERKHWWIQTRFLYIDIAVKKLLEFKGNLKVLEFGCGTGQNLWYLRAQSPLNSHIENLVGVDPNLPESFRPNWLTVNDGLVTSIPETEKSDLILAMDVLEHIEEHQKFLKEWVNHLDSNGLMLITVPAFSFLWSQHDVLLDHKRRYNKYELLEVAKEAGLEPVFISYAFGFIFPLVVLIRKFLPSHSDKTSTDLKLPPFLINGTLKLLGLVESLIGGTPFFGTSVIGIFRKANG